MCRRKYLTALLDYLRGFHQRTQPLQSLAKQLARLEQEFDAQWDDGTVPGWTAVEQVSPSPDHTTLTSVSVHNRSLSQNLAFMLNPLVYPSLAAHPSCCPDPMLTLPQVCCNTNWMLTPMPVLILKVDTRAGSDRQWDVNRCRCPGRGRV